MEREVGGGIGMGNTCKPMAVSMYDKIHYKKKKKRSRCHPQTHMSFRVNTTEARKHAKFSRWGGMLCDASFWIFIYDRFSRVETLGSRGEF